MLERRDAAAVVNEDEKFQGLSKLNRLQKALIPNSLATHPTTWQGAPITTYQLGELHGTTRLDVGARPWRLDSRACELITYPQGGAPLESDGGEIHGSILILHPTEPLIRTWTAYHSRGAKKFLALSALRSLTPDQEESLIQGEGLLSDYYLCDDGAAGQADSIYQTLATKHRHKERGIHLGANVHCRMYPASMYYTHLKVLGALQ
jgi:hypothetical protein